MSKRKDDKVTISLSHKELFEYKMYKKLNLAGLMDLGKIAKLDEEELTFLRQGISGEIEETLDIIENSIEVEEVSPESEEDYQNEVEAYQGELVTLAKTTLAKTLYHLMIIKSVEKVFRHLEIGIVSLEDLRFHTPHIFIKDIEELEDYFFDLIEGKYDSFHLNMEIDHIFEFIKERISSIRVEVDPKILFNLNADQMICYQANETIN